MNKFKLVCEMADIKFKAAQRMEKVTPLRFNALRIAGYCNRLGLNLQTLESFFNAGVTSEEIEEAIFLYRQKNTCKANNFHMKDSENSKLISTILLRVDRELAEYKINNIPPFIINFETSTFELNFFHCSDDSNTSKKYSVFYDVKSIFHKPIVKTVSSLKNEILESLITAGYQVKKVSIYKMDL